MLQFKFSFPLEQDSAPTLHMPATTSSTTIVTGKWYKIYVVF